MGGATASGGHSLTAAAELSMGIAAVRGATASGGHSLTAAVVLSMGIAAEGGWCYSVPWPFAYSRSRALNGDCSCGSHLVTLASWSCEQRAVQNSGKGSEGSALED